MSNSFDQFTQSQAQLGKAFKVLNEMAEVPDTALQTESIYQLDKMRLLHFKAKGRARKTPLLICYALVNRPTILDLEPERSLIKDLCNKGHNVYLIDWGYPDLCDRHLSLEDYIGDYLATAVEQTLQHAKAQQIDLLGVCQGGVFSLCFASLYPEKIRKLVTLVTPVDTEVEGFTLSAMTRETDVNKLVAAYGNLPGSLLNQVYAALKPLQLGVVKDINLANNIKDSASAATFMRMERWINDSPDLAGRAAVEFAELFFQGNGLVNRSIHLLNRQIDLRKITSPVLNIFGKQDHLVPPKSSQALKGLLDSKVDYQELALEGGHIGAFVGSGSRQKTVDAIHDHLKG